MDDDQTANTDTSAENGIGKERENVSQSTGMIQSTQETQLDPAGMPAKACIQSDDTCIPIKCIDKYTGSYGCYFPPTIPRPDTVNASALKAIIDILLRNKKCFTCFTYMLSVDRDSPRSFQRTETDIDTILGGVLSNTRTGLKILHNPDIIEMESEITGEILARRAYKGRIEEFTTYPSVSNGVLTNTFRIVPKTCNDGKMFTIRSTTYKSKSPNTIPTMFGIPLMQCSDLLVTLDMDKGTGYQRLRKGLQTTSSKITNIFDIFMDKLIVTVKLLHAVGIHRDIKPENIAVCDGNVKLLDFGLAIDKDAYDHEESYLGTPGFLYGVPPESSEDGTYMLSYISTKNKLGETGLNNAVIDFNKVNPIFNKVFTVKGTNPTESLQYSAGQRHDLYSVVIVALWMRSNMPAVGSRFWDVRGKNDNAKITTLMTEIKTKYDGISGGTGMKGRSIPSAWTSTGRTVALPGGAKRVLYACPKHPGELRVRRMVSDGRGGKVARYVKVKTPAQGPKKVPRKVLRGGDGSETYTFSHFEDEQYTISYHIVLENKSSFFHRTDTYNVVATSDPNPIAISEAFELAICKNAIRHIVVSAGISVMLRLAVNKQYYSHYKWDGAKWTK